jgi:hypothetical protein
MPAGPLPKIFILKLDYCFSCIFCSNQKEEKLPIDFKGIYSGTLPIKVVIVQLIF